MENEEKQKEQPISRDLGTEEAAQRTGKGKMALRSLTIAIVVLVCIAILALVLVWNGLIGKLGDAEDTVATLSQEEIEALMGTTETEHVLTYEETWPVVVSDEKITNIMLVGQNWREDEQNKLSDTMILCSINRETRTLTMVSFLRDLYIHLPPYAGHGAGRNRINVCYALGSTWKRSSEGGMEMLALCVEQNFGIHVDHTIEVSFETFTNIIDLLGGVEVDITEDEAKYLTQSVGYVDEIKPGVQTLYGNEALAYARIRAIDGDRQRTARQRAVLSSLLEKCRDMSFKDLYTAAGTILPFIITDMTSMEIATYVWEFIPMLKDIQIKTLTCPADNEILPGSYWGKNIELYGYPSSVIECNTTLNGEYLRQALGMEPEAE